MAQLTVDDSIPQLRTTRAFRVWPQFAVGRGDAIAAAFLALFTLAVSARLYLPLEPALQGDWPAEFVNYYGHLGERLRAGDIPDWNPHQFAGAPLAADPQSGWGNLLVMALFTALPLAGALFGFLTLQVAIAGLGTYVLGRLTGLGIVGSLAAAIAYQYTWLADTLTCCIPAAGVGAWLPFPLIAFELFLRAATNRQRAMWLVVGGFAVGQLLANWVGQGGYYAMLLFGGYAAYRLLVVPPPAIAGLRERLVTLVIGVGAMTAFGLVAQAWMILPVLDANRRSTLAGGEYLGVSAWTEANLGWDWPETVLEVAGGYTGTLWWYAGGVALALAALAPFVARRWRPVGYFAAVVLVALVLTQRDPTPIHWAFYRLLPMFETFHVHFPSRILYVAYLPIALLAGATTDAVGRMRPRGGVQALLLQLPVLALLLVGPLFGNPTLISPPTLALVAAVGVALALWSLQGTRFPAWSIPVALALLLTGDSLLQGLVGGDAPNAKRETPMLVPLDQFATRTGAARFLGEQPPGSARYFGFGPGLLPDPYTFDRQAPGLGYRGNRGGTLGYDLLVYDRATLLGLDDLQGYNPVQVDRYLHVINALNGHVQEYHELDVYPDGLSSPLLDALAARFAIVPTDDLDKGAVAELAAASTEVYRDDAVTVLERPTAFPRAWIVHEARQFAPEEGLAAMASGQVDLRREAVLESAPPPLEAAPAGAAERVVIETYEPDRVRVSAELATPGLLVLSEVYDPGWRATVNGASTDVLLANHAFRAVPLPAGTSAVELTYQAPLLRPALALSGAAALGGLAIVGLGLADGRSRRRSL